MRLWRICDADEEARSAATYGAEEVVVLQARVSGQQLWRLGL